MRALAAWLKNFFSFCLTILAASGSGFSTNTSRDGELLATSVLLLGSTFGALIRLCSTGFGPGKIGGTAFTSV